MFLCKQPGFCVTKNFLMVQAPGFIRGINPKSKIENPQAPGFIRGVNLKSQISNLKSIDLRSQYSKTLFKLRKILGAINTAPAWLAATITNLNAPYIAIEKPCFTARESFRGMPKELAVRPARPTPKPHLCKLAIGQCGYFWTQR